MWLKYKEQYIVEIIKYTGCNNLIKYSCFDSRSRLTLFVLEANANQDIYILIRLRL